MNPLWLIQGNIKNKSALEQICNALDKVQVQYELISLIPFVDEVPVTPVSKKATKIICWGPSFVPRALKHPELQPGIWYDEKTFRWTSFKAHWNDLMLSDNATVATFRAVLENISENEVFMRPDADTKAFDGGVYSSTNPPKLYANFKPDTLVVAAPKQKVINEWRFFIVAQEIVASSSYRVLGIPRTNGFVPEEATDLAKQAIQLWQPADVFCLDIGFNGQNYGIIEANCFNASRIYGADILQIVDAVSQFSKQSTA